jgi:2-polyprenyl-3-methyl-5-hydroxy-6-metoxy-1,4-benzoquinol methylase
MNANFELWQKLTEVNAASAFYRLEEFKKGENKLNPLELGEVGSVDGKSLLHLQCHFGMDTLSWARLGARVTGADFSPLAIELAQSLACELNLPAERICKGNSISSIPLMACSPGCPISHDGQR